MPKSDHRDRLIGALATLGAHSRALDAGEASLRDRASAQLDTMGPALHAAGGFVRADHAGGPLGHRVAVTMLHERDRLENVAAPRGGDA